ncbi:MAG: HD domain-containing protein [Bacteroidaceae bacterium]|nr:HD domain-containing protein [Bacteroidaceae bacterium]
MDPQALIHRYYADWPELEDILLRHSERVRDRALSIAARHPELHLDERFLAEAAMLHDIGIVRCNAPGIKCFGTEPYIRHGLLGGEILRSEGLPSHARVAERHTGTGLTAEAIRRQGLPLPERDFVPETAEEQVVCYADKFYSKTRPDVEKTPEQALQSLAKFGEEGLGVFRGWMERFEDY